MCCGNNKCKRKCFTKQKYSATDRNWIIYSNLHAQKLSLLFIECQQIIWDFPNRLSWMPWSLNKVDGERYIGMCLSIHSETTNWSVVLSFPVCAVVEDKRKNESMRKIMENEILGFCFSFHLLCREGIRYNLLRYNIYALKCLGCIDYIKTKLKSRL